MQNKKESDKKESKLKKFFLNALALTLMFIFGVLFNLSLYMTLSLYLPKVGQIIFVIIFLLEIACAIFVIMNWHANYEKKVAPPMTQKN